MKKFGEMLVGFCIFLIIIFTAVLLIFNVNIIHEFFREPDVIVEEVEVVREVEVIKEVEVVVEVPVYVVELKDFSTEEELKKWIASDKTDELEHIPGKFVCWDFALRLQKEAEKDGYRMIIVKRDEHAQNMAYVDGKRILIEPQTDEVWYWIVNETE